MELTSREVVKQTILFQNPNRFPVSFPKNFGDDFAYVGMNQSPDNRLKKGIDEWGCVWENMGGCNMGEVKDFPLKDWSQFHNLQIPDIHAQHRWAGISEARKRAGDKFLLAGGLSIYERAHFIRGLENLWADLYEEPKGLEKLLDILVDMNLVAIEEYKKANADGYMFCDDWGLQDRLMISPDSWRKFWKSRYAKIYDAAHKAGMLTFLHSCGNIVEILDDLIEAGLDVIQMDQQENMGLELLGKRFGGRITFWCPVDIQSVMYHGTLDEIRSYARKMAQTLGKPQGGFMAKWYPDPVAVGHKPEAVDAMCEEFVRLRRRPRA